MAVDETSFTNIIGKEITRSLIVQQMVDYYFKKLELGETKITDFNEGSEIRNLLEAFAVDIYALLEDQYELSKIAFIETAEGEWLDKHGASPQINLPRNEGSSAEGEVVFTLPAPATVQTFIPVGTIIYSEVNGLEYETENEAIFDVGDETATAHAICLDIGEIGNVDIGEINVIEDGQVEISGLEVSNTEPFTRGSDYELDYEYKERLLAYEQKNNFGSYRYYEDLAKNIKGVHDVVFYDNPNKPNVTKTIIINGDEKPVSDEIIEDVAYEFNNLNNLVINHSFALEKVQYFDVAFNISLTVEEEIPESDILDILTIYFDGGEFEVSITDEGLNIGQYLSKDSIYSTLQYFSEIISIYIEYDGSELIDIYLDGENKYKVFNFDRENTTITQTIQGE